MTDRRDQDAPPPEFSRMLRLRDISTSGRTRQKLTASPRECEALARRFDLASVTGLEADLAIAETGSGIFHVTGSLEAEVSLVGDVSGETVDLVVGDEIDEVLATVSGWEALEAESVDGEVDAELITGDAVDLGEIVAQNLSLALDPVMFDAAGFDDGVEAYSSGGDAEDDGAPDHPFAALAALRRSSDTDEQA